LKTPLPSAKPATTPVTVAKANADVKAAPETKETKTEINPNTKPNAETAGTLSWSWPTKGKVISGFNDGGNKGIDITGSKGQPILAAAPGKVIYSGSDLRGYGKLVIVKHNNTYLSVYANNSNILVKEGQQVSTGQKIAEMGDSDSNTVKLHFEIRQQGKSVDPAKFLAVN
jgi:lipoprotein NlpD